jgi:hypothetical protein
VSRRARLLRATPNAWRRSVATGGRPERAVCAALLEVPFNRGEVWTTDIQHDDGCLTLRGHGLRACSCEIVELKARRVA